jgi:hypothetical protein
MIPATAADWNQLLERRPSFRGVLEPLGRVIAAWAATPADSGAPLACTQEEAADRWSSGDPLITLEVPRLPAEPVERGLHPALELLGRTEGTKAFVEAWNRGELDAASLLPREGRLVDPAIPQRFRLSHNAIAFLALAGLRPALTAWFARCRSLATDGLWERGTCPCCGGPPAFADLLEDGRRQICCHLCDTRWTLARLACPLCGTRSNADLVRLIAEGSDEGYAIAACRACRGYIKELDRRARWNAGSAIVEDWGSPHLDLIAHRQGYWRPVPTLVQLSLPEDGP